MQSKLGVVLGVIGVVLALVAMVGPWWTMSYQFSALGRTATGVADFGLFGGTATITTPLSSTTNSSDYKNSPHVGSVFTLATALLALGLLIGIAMVVLAAMSNPSFRRYGAILGILAALLVLLAPLYVMSALPDAVNQDSGSVGSFSTVSGFWGTKSTTVFGLSASVTWWAGWVWYLAIIAAVVFLIGGILLLMARKPVMAAAPQMPPPSP